MNFKEAQALAAELRKKQSKYKAVKVVIDKITFDSQKEGLRYLQLKEDLRVNKILSLSLQPSFILQDAFIHEGTKHKAIKYISDFKYTRANNGIIETVIEDTKGFLTDIYKLKKKMFLMRYGKDYTFIES